MKKTFVSILVTIAIVVGIMPMYVQAGVIGEVLNTDIVAYIDGLPIRSYNINGFTGIIAEDLRDYGFDVYWMPDERSLFISYYDDTAGEVTANYTPEENKNKIGSHAMDVYSTDIKTYVYGNEVEAFNVGGMTVIYIDYLKYFGGVRWFDDERKICYTHEKPWTIRSNVHSDSYGLSRNIDSFSWNITRDEKGDFVSSGENIEYLTGLKLSRSKGEGTQVSFSIYQDVMDQTAELSAILHSTIMERYDEAVSDSADMANKHISVVINGEPVEITYAEQSGGNGHTDYYFTVDKAISKDEIKTVSVVCK